MSKVEQSKKLELERIIFIGRTYEEYMDMFSLSKKDISGKKILDCPAGACSFTALANRLGADVTACDIAYYYTGVDLKNKGLQDIKHAMTSMEKVKENFVWDYFKNIEELKTHRLSALNECANDMTEHSERYIPVTLPALPFENEEFDIILSAHFLFMYADRLDYKFHLQTIDELLRISKDEIRIFPLVDLEGKRYKHLDKIINYLKEKNCTVEERKAAYEFQKNANSLLKITKR
ncbi:SAM-dependent methyltransferase [Bacillus taeanensis]|uniref:SAM-dependent methyltransferase n=1 Tax=Bacillus taeanensis TaxID=273032 RepID=A0A366XTJ8_9BACI|nr:SAM-dependent methyltransferase [Bacillus taeanensis]RBW67483.1 SAM-dependent methyltransferase [Bacillus taeanensis]